MKHSHRITRRLAQAGSGVTIAAAALGFAGATALAAPGAVMDFPAAGNTIDCTVGGQPISFYTTDGNMHMVNQAHQDANGVWHLTGTLSLQHVTATGSDGNTYSVVGASWYGGSGSDPSSITTHSTDEFNIIGPGGKVAAVHAEAWFSPNGTPISIHLDGTCAPVG